MDTGLVMANVGVLVSLILGVTAIFKPQKIQEFVSLRAYGKEGESEIRATYGGFFAGMSIYALIAQSNEVFAMIGVAWLSASCVRLISMMRGAQTLKNFGGVLFESCVGVLCLSIFL